MFIIFGFGRRTVRLLGFTAARLCGNCHNTSPWKVMKITRWFTLFFIPVIPYSSKYVAMCPTCSRGVELDAKAAQGLASGGGAVTDGEPQASPIPAPTTMMAPAPVGAYTAEQMPPWARTGAPAQQSAAPQQSAPVQP
jgi:hypothetical protein